MSFYEKLQTLKKMHCEAVEWCQQTCPGMYANHLVKWKINKFCKMGSD